MTQQAMNYVLTGLEEGGYLQRQDADAPTGRVVRVSVRGRRVMGVLRAEVEQIQREWAAHLGASRFRQLRDTLHDLAAWLGKFEAR
jgi:DNA-binding MarR family transcriptional regulator